MEDTAKILLLRCEETGEEFEVSSREETTIGNGPDCTIVIPDEREKIMPKGDRKDECLHIAYRADRFWLSADSQADKKRLNHEVIREGTQYPLKEGDRLSLAGRELIVEEIREESDYPNDIGLGMPLYAPPEWFFGNG